jgi:hypothetical protein
MPRNWSWKTAWVILWAALFAISLALPALVHSETGWVHEGHRAALLALVLPAVWGEPLGGFLMLTHPLLVVTLVGTWRSRAFAVGAAVALVATMALWGFSAPDEPRSNIFGGTDPGGDLAAGYWVWLASGICLVLASVGTAPTRAHATWVAVGLAYALLVVVAAWRSLTFAKEAQQASEGEAKRVLEYKTKRAQEAREPAERRALPSATPP